MMRLVRDLFSGFMISLVSLIGFSCIAILTIQECPFYYEGDTVTKGSNILIVNTNKLLSSLWITRLNRNKLYF